MRVGVRLGGDVDVGVFACYFNCCGLIWNVPARICDATLSLKSISLRENRSDENNDKCDEDVRDSRLSPNSEFHNHGSEQELENSQHGQDFKIASEEPAGFSSYFCV